MASQWIRAASLADESPRVARQSLTGAGQTARSGTPSPCLRASVVNLLGLAEWGCPWIVSLRSQ